MKNWGHYIRNHLFYSNIVFFKKINNTDCYLFHNSGFYTDRVSKFLFIPESALEIYSPRSNLYPKDRGDAEGDKDNKKGGVKNIFNAG